MTNKEFAKAYFDQAEAIRREIENHYKDMEWHLVVRRAQEAVELILKGFLRQAGIEIPRIHDVGGILMREQKRLPQRITKSLDRIISVSRRLRQERETSFYGDEEQELPSSALYTKLGACRSIRRKRKFQWRRPSEEDEQKNRRRSHSYVDGFFAKSDEAGRMPMKFAAGEYSDRLLDADEAKGDVEWLFGLIAR